MAQTRAGGPDVIEMHNDKLSVYLDCDEHGLKVRRVLNKLADASVEFDAAGMALVVGKDEPVVLPQDEMLIQGDVESAASTAKAKLAVPDGEIEVALTYELTESTVRLLIGVSNKGPDEIYLRDVVVFDGRTAARTVCQESRFDITLGEAGELDAEVLKRVDAHPVFLDDHVFCGIDWPVAQNAASEGRLVCRQFCGDRLAPGARLQTRTFTIGVSRRGRVPQAFLKHLNRLRGRPTRRASFYFDWVTHAWEGVDESETAKLLDMFAALRAQFGVQFDIYGVDAGIVENIGRLYFDQFRLQHDCMYPGGLIRPAARARDLGMDFGVWMGPDGFGDTEASARRRVEQVVRWVSEWNVGLFKVDTVVSAPLGDDPYRNEHYMRNLERLTNACREANPELIIINHRATTSPYVLGIFDSTLWMGAESYCDVHIHNDDKSRIFTRYAAYGRGEPSYYGAYSPLLEDHGVCLNGDHRGWADELVVQTFGRALMLSPEVYGTMFLLPDSEYAELARLLRLARQKRHLLSHTEYVQGSGDFLHSDGRAALICLINDSWKAVERRIEVGPDLGLEGPAGPYVVTRHFPQLDGDADAPRSAEWGDAVTVGFRPFGACVLEVAPSDEAGEGRPAALNAPVLTLPPGKMDRAGVPLGRFEQSAPTAADVGRAELVRFTLSNDPLEAQAEDRLEPSGLPEVNACRKFFRDKMRRVCYGIAANAWDDDPTTAWSDAGWWENITNVWRLDLGARYPVERVEVSLANLALGPVIGIEQGRELERPIVFEVSADGAEWHPSEAMAYIVGWPFPPHLHPRKLIAEFADLPAPVRYVRLKVRGIVVGDIRVRQRTSGELSEVPRGSWHGNNLFTTRPPQVVYSRPVRLDEAWDGRYASMIARLPEGTMAPLKQEVAMAWLESADGGHWPAVVASPAYPFHAWEFNTNRDGFAWTFSVPTRAEMVGRDLTAKLAWFGPEMHGAEWAAVPLPEVTGHLVAVK